MSSQLTGCPAPPPMLKPDQISKTASMMTSMGAKTCATSSKSEHTNVSMDVLGGFLSSTNIDVDKNESGTYGCEQMIASSSTYNTALSNISCIIKKTAVSVDNTASGINNIIFKVGGNYTVHPGGSVKIKQIAKVSLVNVSKISDVQKNEIASQVKAVTDDVKKTIQDSKTATGSTAQGGKSSTEINSIYQQSDFNKSVNESLKSFSAKASGSNTILFEVGGDMDIWAPLESSQDLVVDLLSKSIVDDALENSFKSISEITNRNVAENKQKSDNSGFADIYSSLYSGTGFTKIIKMVIGALVLLIILFVGYKIYQKKKSMTGF